MARKTVLVTGASRGIGKATALRCLKDGLEVIGLSTTARDDLPWPHYGVDLGNSSSKAQLQDIITKTSTLPFCGQCWDSN